MNQVEQRITTQQNNTNMNEEMSAPAVYWEELEELDYGDAKRFSHGSYVQGSPFVKLLGGKGKAAILDVFLGKHYRQLTGAQVADYAGIDPSTFYRNIDSLRSMEVVKQAEDTAGGAQLYELNKDSDIARLLGHLHREISLTSFSEDPIDEGE